MSWIDLIGFSASFAVLATFCMGTMVSLRAVAILSNALFIAYGIGQHLYPVLLLHAVLLPINLLKIVQLRREFQQVFRGGAHSPRQAVSNIDEHGACRVDGIRRASDAATAPNH